MDDAVIRLIYSICDAPSSQQQIPEKTEDKGVKGSSVLPILAVLMVLVPVVTMPVRAEVETNETIHWEKRQWISCAMDGAGEWVLLSGDMHVVYSTTLDGRGGFHARVHYNPQGITGTGEESGDKYHAVGVTRRNTNGKVGETYTFVNNYKIIGQGKGNNFLVHYTIHHTVNANGEVNSEVTDTWVKCK